MSQLGIVRVDQSVSALRAGGDSSAYVTVANRVNEAVGP